MNLKQQIRSRFLNFLKHYFNPITRRIAQSPFGPFGVVRHIGRRSGKHYETPIVIQPSDNGFIIELTYGPEVDWYQNVLAARGCIVHWHGKDYTINKIERLDAQIGLSAFPLPARILLRLAQRHDFAKMLIGTAATVQKS